MGKTFLCKGMASFASLAALFTVLSAPARADTIKVTMTVDNSYAMYYGTGTAATNFVGSDFNWPTVETYTFNLPSTSYLYIVTVSDVAVAQGFLGQFENLTTGYKFYSQDVQWQVTATGLRDPNAPNYGAPYTGSAGDLSTLTTQINVANGGGNPSNGWVSTTAGPNNGGGPWGTMPGIDAAARWVWYSSNGDPDPTDPGFDHDEWLIFRISFGATPVPVPSSFVMVCIGAAVLASYRWYRTRHSRHTALNVA